VRKNVEILTTLKLPSHVCDLVDSFGSTQLTNLTYLSDWVEKSLISQSTNNCLIIGSNGLLSFSTIERPN